MKHIKLFNEMKLTDTVRCNWCDWSGTKEEKINNRCPYCGCDQFFMNLDPLSDKEIEFAKNLKPLSGVNINDYKNPREYFNDAYPIQKFNL